VGKEGRFLHLSGNVLLLLPRWDKQNCALRYRLKCARRFNLKGRARPTYKKKKGRRGSAWHAKRCKEGRRHKAALN